MLGVRCHVLTCRFAFSPSTSFFFLSLAISRHLHPLSPSLLSPRILSPGGCCSLPSGGCCSSSPAWWRLLPSSSWWHLLRPPPRLPPPLPDVEPKAAPAASPQCGSVAAAAAVASLPAWWQQLPPPPRHRADGGSYSPFPAWRRRLWRLLPSPGVVVAAARCPLLPGCPSSPRCGADGASLLHRDGLIWEYFEDFVIWDVDSVTTVMRIKFLAIKFMSSRLNLTFSYCFWSSRLIDLGSLGDYFSMFDSDWKDRQTENITKIAKKRGNRT